MRSWPPRTGAFDPTYWRSRGLRDNDTKDTVFLQILNQCMS